MQKCSLVGVWKSLKYVSGLFPSFNWYSWLLTTTNLTKNSKMWLFCITLYFWKQIFVWNRNDIRFVKIILLSIRIFFQDMKGILNIHNFIILAERNASRKLLKIFTYILESSGWMLMFNVNQINSRTELFVTIERSFVPSDCILSKNVLLTPLKQEFALVLQKADSKISWKFLRKH